MKLALARALIRIRARSDGLLRRQQWLSEVLGVAMYLRWRTPLGNPLRRYEALLTAARRTRIGALQRAVSRALFREFGVRADHWRAAEPGLKRYRSSFGGIQKPALTTSLVLKAPGPHGEKGVLYSSFEYNWVRLAKHHDARAFLRQYTLVGQTSGSPPDFAPISYLAGLADSPIFLGVSNLSDVTGLSHMRPVVEPITIMACDWVDPAGFQPRDRASRVIDVIMVANWLRLKRHWLLFDALRRMRRDLRVVLVGRNADGRTEQDLRREARAFGAMQELEIHTNIPNEAVRDLLCQARVSVLFSYREGSCVAPVESMFADTPVGMMQDAHVGSRAYINAQTGMLFHRFRSMTRQLESLLERGSEMAPREWALQHISCHRSNARLNDVLRTEAQRAGRPWTSDLAGLCWRYAPDYVDPKDWMRLEQARRQLQKTYGIELARFVYRPDVVKE